MVKVEDVFLVIVGPEEYSVVVNVVVALYEVFNIMSAHEIMWWIKVTHDRIDE